MCEKCENPKLEHLEHLAIKPFQKKLNTTSLKGKIKAKKITSN